MKKFQQLFTVAMALLAVNLLVLNDWILIWDGAELNSILQSQEAAVLPGTVLQSIWDYKLTTYAFFWRLPSAIVLMIGLFTFYQIAKLLFGQIITQYSLMTLAASFLVLNYAKLGSHDAWVFVTQGLSWIILLVYLKQPILKWQLSFYLLAGFAVWLQPIESSLFLVINAVMLYFLHPNKTRVLKLNPIAPVLGSILLFTFTTGLDWKATTSYWSIFNAGHMKFFVVTFMSWFLFFGFFLGGLREIFNKIRKKEELAIVLTAGLVAGLLGHAIVLHLVIAIMVGRQLNNYFGEKYPYEALVKTGFILHLVFAFAIATVFMIYSFVEFKGPGFRAALSMTMIYWMGAFLGVLGLYGKNIKYVHWGMILGGGLTTLIFYLQLAPLIQTKRAVVVEAIKQAKTRNYKEETLYLNTSEELLDKIKLYGSADFPNIIQDPDSTKPSPKIIEQINPIDSTSKDSTYISGWKDNFDLISLEVQD